MLLMQSMRPQGLVSSLTICHACRSSPLIHPGPSVDDQVRRLQQEDAVAGNGLRRRRSSSMDRLYGIPEQKAPTGSRLRSASTADPEDCEVLYDLTTHEISNARNVTIDLCVCRAYTH